MLEPNVRIIEDWQRFKKIAALTNRENRLCAHQGFPDAEAAKETLKFQLCVVKHGDDPAVVALAAQQKFAPHSHGTNRTRYRLCPARYIAGQFKSFSELPSEGRTSFGNAHDVRKNG
jgi:hypothetical protein